MKVNVDELNQVQRKVTVELPPETVASEFSRAYKTLGQRVRVKGFRAGKIPRHVLQGMYGEEIKGQVKAQLVERSLGDVIKERGLEIVSRPEVEANEMEEGSPFSFSALFEVKPAIEVKNYLGVELQRARLSVTDAQVEDALGRLQESFARLELVESRRVVQRGDFITLDFEGSIDGKPFPGGKGENYLLEVGAGRTVPQFEDALIGLEAGVSRQIQVRYPEDYPNKEIAGKSVDFGLVVREIKEKVLPPIDDDFAKDHGECGSLEELRGKIRARLQDEMKHIQDDELKERLVQKLLESHPFSPPPSMVERQTRYLMERYQTQAAGQSRAGSQEAPSLEEARKTMEARALRQVQATLLIEKVAERENIGVADQEVQDKVASMSRAAGERGKAVREFYAKPEARDDLRAQMIFDRTVEFLLQRAKIEELDLPASKVDERGEKS